MESRDSYDDLPAAGDIEPAENASRKARDSFVPRGTFASEEIDLGEGDSPAPGGAGSWRAGPAHVLAPDGAAAHQTADAEPRASDSNPPLGTFASDPEPEPEPARTETPEHLRSPPATAPVPANPSTAAAIASATTIFVQPAQAPAAPAPPASPPFLASRILREELTPREPGSQVLLQALWTATALGLLVAWLGRATPAGALIAVGALAGLGMSIPRLGYASRAASALSVSGVSFGIVVLWAASIEDSINTPLLASSIAVSMSALWLRAWHRASATARALAAVGSVGQLAWLVLSGRPQLLSLQAEWQSWLPALLWITLPMLSLLGLLAFMGRHTTGACDVWAMGLAGWYFLYAAVREATVYRGGFDTLATLRLGEPVFAMPVAVAFAQLLAAIECRRRARQAVVSEAPGASSEGPATRSGVRRNGAAAEPQPTTMRSAAK